MSVESATAQMANTTLNDANAGAAEPINASQNEAVIASAAEGRRLYIGNLAYATTEGELKEFFKDYLVETTSIPTNPRTTRPVGYAFVDVSTPNEAERAINDLNGKSILDRKVSVQLARKPEPAAAATTEGGEEGDARRRASTRGRGRGRGRGAAGATRGGRNGTKADGEGEEGVNGENTVLPLTAATNETDKREARPRKQRGPPEGGIPSKTKVMVANLPYELREEKLLELFADYSPTSAKIALRPIPKYMIRKLQAKNEPRKGRGFGFVTLASEELQQKACEEMNEKTIDNRKIAVKVAIDSPGKEDEEANEEAAEAAAKEVEPAAAA